MSHPQGLEPDEVKDEDDAEHEVDYDLVKDDGSEDNRLEIAKEDEDKRMEEHFTKEPDNFGGSNSWI